MLRKIHECTTPRDYMGVGGGCVPSCAERKAKDNLKIKMCKTPDLDSFVIEGENFPHVLCI